MRARIEQGLAYLGQPVNASSVRLFRTLFGSLMFIGVVRFFSYGWIEQHYVQPAFFFTFGGFDWVRPWPSPWMHVHFGLLGLLSLIIVTGRGHRVTMIAFFFAFTYVELIDKTNYLNHYYLVSLLAALMVLMPLGREDGPHVPRWCLWSLRMQVGLVYFFAGVAKLRPDWLFHAQPLSIWFAARTDTPLLGPFLTLPHAAVVASWTGAVFDLSLPFLLLHRRTRAVAFCAAVVFHGVTGLLFQLGLFPWLMVAGATLFFEPSWPESVLGRKRASELPKQGQRLAQMHRGLALLLGVHFVAQCLLPLRKHIHPGDVAWHERGFRFAWHVMLAEKSGVVWFEARDELTDERWRVDQRKRLSPRQLKMMSTSPEMIEQFGRHLARVYREQGRCVVVRAEAYVALNGRPSKPLTGHDEPFVWRSCA